MLVCSKMEKIFKFKWGDCYMNPRFSNSGLCFACSVVVGWPLLATRCLPHSLTALLSWIGERRWRKVKIKTWTLLVNFCVGQNGLALEKINLLLISDNWVVRYKNKTKPTFPPRPPSSQAQFHSSILVQENAVCVIRRLKSVPTHISKAATL